MKKVIFHVKGSLGNHSNHVLHTYLYNDELLCGVEATQIKGQSLFLWDWIKLSQSIENQEHLSS
jgi:hypothetical protein